MSRKQPQPVPEGMKKPEPPPAPPAVRRPAPPMLDNLPDPMKPSEVAALLRVSAPIVYHLIATGKLHALDLGRGKKKPLLLIRKEDYLRWFNGEGK